MEELEKTMESPNERLEAIEQAPYFEWVGSAADHFKALRDKAQNEGNLELAKRAQFEIDIFCLEVKHPFINLDANRRFVGRLGYSNGTEWPDATTFSKEQMLYYETRLSQSRNPFLKARYADLLFDRWTSDRKLNKFELGTILCELLTETAQAHLAHPKPGLLGFLWNMARAVEVAVILNNGELLQKATSPISPVLEGLDDDRLRWVYEISLIFKGVAKSRMGAFLPPEEYQRVTRRVEDARRFFWQNKAHMVWHRSFCEELLYWGRLLGWEDESLRAIQIEIGQSFEEEAAHARDHRNSHMLEAGFLEKALEHYVNIGHVEQLGELKRRIQEAHAASKDEYQEVSFRMEIPMEAISIFLRPYEELDLDQCLGLAGADPRLIIEAESVVRSASKFRESSPLLFLSSKFVVDHDRKVFQADSEEASLKFVGDLEYKQRLLLNNEVTLKSLFQFLVEQRGLTGEGLFAFLREWPLLDENNAAIIEVGLKQFFDTDYVSALHVLVPQLESCVRKMFAKAGISTTSFKRPAIQHEQTFNEFLERDEVKEVLGKDRHKYLQMVMVDPLGLNLRNEIAHGLVKPSECNESNVLIIIHLFLILTRFQANNPAVL